MSALETDKRELKQLVTEKVCEGIEDQFGRQPLLVVDNSEFMKDRLQCTEKALNSKHIDENMGCTFIDLIRDMIRESNGKGSLESKSNQSTRH